MKNKLPLLALICTLSSCSVSTYYQIFTAVPVGGNTQKEKIVFEDNNLIVSYHLWKDGGDIGFQIFNKTEGDIVVDLTKSFFVLNGVANQYFQNRTISISTTNGSMVTKYYYPSYLYWTTEKVTGTNLKTYTTSSTELPTVTIPSATSIIISTFRIADSRYENCDLPTFPYSRKRIRTLKFDKSGSPFVFSNIISYTANGDTDRTENKFYVSEITNYPSQEVVRPVYTTPCGEGLNSPRYIFRDPGPDKFYIKYRKN